MKTIAKGRQAMDVILKYNQMKQPGCTYLAVARGQALQAAGCLIVRAAEVIGTRRGKAGRKEWPIVARPCLGNSVMKIQIFFFFLYHSFVWKKQKHIWIMTSGKTGSRSTFIQGCSAAHTCQSSPQQPEPSNKHSIICII